MQTVGSRTCNGRICTTLTLNEAHSHELAGLHWTRRKPGTATKRAPSHCESARRHIHQAYELKRCTASNNLQILRHSPNKDNTRPTKEERAKQGLAGLDAASKGSSTEAMLKLQLPFERRSSGSHECGSIDAPSATFRHGQMLQSASPRGLC